MHLQSTEEPSLLTAAGMERFALSIRDNSRGVLIEHGYHIPVVLMVMTRDPDSGVLFPEPQVHQVAVAPELMPTGEMTPELQDNFGKFIAQLVRKSAAAGLIYISEAWVAPVANSGEASLWKGNVRNHPERTERLTVHVEHRKMIPTQQAWDAIIRRDPFGNVIEMGPWMKVGGEQLMRLCGFLPPSN